MRLLKLSIIALIFICSSCGPENKIEDAQEHVFFGSTIGEYDSSWYTGQPTETFYTRDGKVVPSGIEIDFKLKELSDFQETDIGKLEETFMHTLKGKEGVVTYDTLKCQLKEIPLTSEITKTNIILDFNTETISLLEPISYESDNSGRDQKNIDVIDITHNMGGTYITSIIEDQVGNIWIAGFEGCSVVSREYISGVKFGKNHPFIRSMTVDGDNNIWMGSEQSGVYVYNGNSGCQLTRENGLRSDSLFSVDALSNGTIVFTYYNGNISILENNNSLVHYPELDSFEIPGATSYKNKTMLFGRNDIFIINEKRIQVITPDKNDFQFTKSISIDSNSVQIGSTAGAFLFSENTLQEILFPEKFKEPWVTDITIENGKTIYSTYSGILTVENEELSTIDNSSGLSDNYISTIHVDRSSNIWAASYGNGVNIIPPVSFEQVTNGSLYEDASVMTIKELSGEIFMSGYDGILKCRNDSIFQINIPTNIDYRTVYGPIIKDSTYWFTLKSVGILKLDYYNNATLINRKNNQGNRNWYRRIDKDLENNVWFGNDLPIVFKNDKFFELTNFPTNSLELIGFTFSKGHNNELFFPMYSTGMVVFRNNTFKIISEREGLSSNESATSIVDPYGGVWSGDFTHGIDIIRNDSIFHIDKTTGLSGDIVASLELDGNNDVWVSTSTGLNLIKYRKDSKNWKDFQIIQFSTKDGLNGWDLHQDGTMIDKSGYFWVSGSGGVSKINTNSIFEDSVEVELNSIMINEHFKNFNLDGIEKDKINFDSVQAFYNYPLNLQLSHDKNHLFFSYGAKLYRNLHRLEYSHRITSISNIWSKPSNLAFADYRNLPSGKHIFEVRAREKGSVWGETFKYEFTILPPWYHTWWARILYGVIIILVIALFVRSRTAKLKKRQAELETEVANATHEILQQKEIVEEAHKEITDSINYAERIQRSFLATETLLKDNLGEHFIYFNPKEAVSGDFYWAGELDNGNFAVSCADSTGHGVPGAIMSILNISSIEKAVENKASKPAEIFNQARKLIIERLKKDGSPEGGKDGMDASLISFNPEKTIMHYVAAHNPIWIIRGGELIDIKAEKMPVGKHDHDHIPFEGGEFELQKGDIIYTLTDGYQDQFGGEKGKKYKVKPFKRLLLEICELSMQEQHQKISETFDEWKRDLEQVDDVCVIGVRV